MYARHFVRAALVALLATTGCANARGLSSSSRTVCTPRGGPGASAHSAVHAEIGFAAESGVVRNAGAKVAPVVVVRDDEIATGGRTLWAVPSDGPVETPRVFEIVATDGYAVVFRQGDAIWVGAFDAQATPVGPLYRVGGHGRWLGAPAVRIDGAAVHLAFSDGDQVKVAVWQPSRSPDAPRALAVHDVERFCEAGSL